MSTSTNCIHVQPDYFLHSYASIIKSSYMGESFCSILAQCAEIFCSFGVNTTFYLSSYLASFQPLNICRETCFIENPQTPLTYVAS